MIVLGSVGVIAGAVMIVYSLVVFSGMGLVTGLIAALYGAVCLTLDSVCRRLDELEARVASLDSDKPVATEDASEQVVEELREEGLLRRPGSESDNQSSKDTL